ncbi:GIY-YIG nuclease family protein [Priestia megaterium]|uniref:GIY-YIG nuclease family protein n=1 Tax=Priestia megaterium TaxID=1404 RepID=UPI0039F6706D
MYTVYKITCKPISRDYFGRSQELEKRWRSHKNMLRTNSHYSTEMQRDWNKYGEGSFSFEVLATFEEIEACIAEEQRLIDESIEVSYNISNSKSGGDTFTYNPRREEIRELHRKLSSGENNPMYGKPKSKYTLQRIKEANSKPINIDGTTYPSISYASEVLGVNVTTICYRLNSNSNRFKSWVYVDKEMPNDYRNHA